MAAQKILILHPGQRPGITSVKQAKWYVRRNRAEWVEQGRSIRFFAEHHQNSAATIANMKRVTIRLQEIGYDDNVVTDGCTRQELKNLPMCGNIDRLIGRGQQRRKGAAQAA